jgi:vacuolar protein sorting-associated protein 16
MTCDRYTQLSPTQLIARLTSRNLHLLALRISSFLELPSSAVLKHWACAKIISYKTSASADSGVDDDTVCNSIVEKFEKLGGTDVSYAEIARKAWEIGRTDLATKVNISCLPIMLRLNIVCSFLIMSPDHQTKCRCCSA